MLLGSSSRNSPFSVLCSPLIMHTTKILPSASNLSSWALPSRSAFDKLLSSAPNLNAHPFPPSPSSTLTVHRQGAPIGSVLTTFLCPDGSKQAEGSSLLKLTTKPQLSGTIGFAGNPIGVPAMAPSITPSDKAYVEGIASLNGVVWMR